MDINVLNKLNVSALAVYSSVTLIDINNDKVTLFSALNGLEEKESNTYEEYYEKLKKVIHPDFLNNYFDAISLNNLESTDNSYKCIKYMKLSSNLSYDNYIDIVRLIGERQILVLSLKYDCEEKEMPKDDDLNYIVADTIVNVESALSSVKVDSYEVKNLIKYVSELLNDIKHKNKKVLQKYTEKVATEVNKTHESLLIIDDDNLTRNIFKKIFESDYNIIEAKNGSEAVDIIEKNIVNGSSDENIVGMFLDLKMPIMDGFGVLNYLNNKQIINRLPVIIISADDAKETKEEVYKYEIADMLEKPFNYELIKKRVNNMVRMYAKSNVLNNLIRSQHTNLKSIIKSYVNSYLVDYDKTNELLSKYGKIVLDKYISMHELKDDADVIISASKYFDVALDLVPRKYLDNIKNLTPEQRDVVINYPKMGVDIISVVNEGQSDSFVRYAINISKMRNERYDGLGFPSSLKEDNIPYYVYLINMTIDYVNYVVSHSNIDENEIKTILTQKSGNKYDPKLVEFFISMLGELR